MNNFFGYSRPRVNKTDHKMRDEPKVIGSRFSAGSPEGMQKRGIGVKPTLLTRSRWNG